MKALDGRQPIIFSNFVYLAGISFQKIKREKNMRVTAASVMNYVFPYVL